MINLTLRESLPQDEFQPKDLHLQAEPWEEERHDEPQKQELLDTVRPRYYKAGRKEKKRILDKLVANTGYQRKYVIQVLN